jgi:hypothetical protein
VHYFSNDLVLWNRQQRLLRGSPERRLLLAVRDTELDIPWFDTVSAPWHHGISWFHVHVQMLQTLKNICDDSVHEGEFVEYLLLLCLNE